jgi:hypothetical protein
MTKVPRLILVVVNLLLLVLGSGLLATSIVVQHSSNFVLRFHPQQNEVAAKVYQITDIKKLQAMAANQYEYLDNLATMIENFRDLNWVAAVLVLSFSALNFILIPWKLRKREHLA